jgi:hypothetical protein
MNMQMNLLRAALSVFLGTSLLITGFSRAEASAEDAAPYMNFRGGAKGMAYAPDKQKTTKRKKKNQVRRVNQSLPLSAQAREELDISPEAKTSDVVDTAATVKAQALIEPAERIESEVEVGLTIQPFRPQGRGHVDGFDSYDLGSLGDQPMLAIEARTLPLALEEFPYIDIGGSLAIGYAQHAVNLRGTTGMGLERTKLHSISTQLMALARANLFGVSPWSLLVKAGAGRLDSMQTGETVATNESSHLWYAGSGAFLERRLSQRLSAFGGYEYRLPVSKTSADLDLMRHNFLLGVMGGFQ